MRYPSVQPQSRCGPVSRAAVILCLLGVLISSDDLKSQSDNADVTISGKVVDESGQLVSDANLSLLKLEFIECCDAPPQGELSFEGGTFSFEAEPGVYALTANPPTPYNVAHLRVDARSGNVSGLQIEVRAGPSSFFPDVPPRASLIDVSAPDTANQVTVTGRAGSVPVGSYVIVVTLDTGHFTWTEAGEDGTFEATLFAPAGSSILIKADPVGLILSRVLAEMSGGGEGNIAPLSGTILHVANPPVSGEEIPFGGAAAFGDRTLPVWVLTGTIDRQEVDPGESIRIRGKLEIRSPLLQDIESMEVYPSFRLERLSGPQGYGSLAQNIFASIFLTPTGLPIERVPIGTDFAATMVQMNKVAEDRVEASLDLAMPVPADLPAGYYVLRGTMAFTDPVLGEFPNDIMIHVDKVGLRFPYFPVIRVGDPAPPRLFWTLLTDTLSNGTRGVGAVEDRERFALAPRILTQSETFIIPKVDSASGAPLTYRLEPFAPTVSRGDRGVLPAPPVIPFQFPSGSLTVTIRKPDGSVDVLGPAPFVQARTRSLVDRTGVTLDHDGGHMTDVYQLSTMDPQFEVQFTQEGRHVITLNGNVEDIWENQERRWNLLCPCGPSPVAGHGSTPWDAVGGGRHLQSRFGSQPSGAGRCRGSLPTGTQFRSEPNGASGCAWTSKSVRLLPTGRGRYPARQAGGVSGGHGGFLP